MKFLSFLAMKGFIGYAALAELGKVTSKACEEVAINGHSCMNKMEVQKTKKAQTITNVDIHQTVKKIGETRIYRA